MKLGDRGGEKSEREMTAPRVLSLGEIDRLRNQGVILIDAREGRAFASGHIPGSINIPHNELFTTWAGWILNPKKPFVLIAPAHSIPELVTALHRMGQDGMTGYLPGVHHWARSGRPLAQLPQMDAQELANALLQKRAVAIDVREPDELHSGFIPGAIAVPARRLIRRLRQPDTQRQLVFYCDRGDRSAIVASYLRHLGIRNVMSLREGILGWQAAGLELDSPEAALGFEQIDVMEAFRRSAQQGWALIDVREADAFQQGHPPGALNFPLDDFIEGHVIETLSKLEPLLLICNTGNRSAMAAEWLLDEGMTRIANVAGGVVAWQLHHLPWQK